MKRVAVASNKAVGRERFVSRVRNPIQRDRADINIATKIRVAFPGSAMTIPKSFSICGKKNAFRDHSPAYATTPAFDFKARMSGAINARNPIVTIAALTRYVLGDERQFRYKMGAKISGHNLTAPATARATAA